MLLSKSNAAVLFAFFLAFSGPELRFHGPGCVCWAEPMEKSEPRLPRPRPKTRGSPPILGIEGFAFEQ